MARRSPCHPRPLTPYHPNSHEVRRFTFPVSLARTPPQYGRESPTIQMSENKSHVSQKDVLEKILTNSKSGKNLLSTLCCLLSYVGEILGAIKRQDEQLGASSPATENEISVTLEPDSDWEEDLSHEEEDSAGEDSDEDSMNNKLCTFTVTQKEFMNQHW
ncbi:UBR4-like protein [Mya arenaria]|uniref:UBR4-like protein n=1 Tax=Mya arenaria TaxID=6604 RepID=A0ABY7G8C1_MYAAR|nr:UBR4-like protein [Mya arenaria]